MVIERSLAKYPQNKVDTLFYCFYDGHANDNCYYGICVFVCQ